MRTTVRTALAAATAVGLLAVPVAATASDTTVSFTVAASGALAVSQTASTATLDDGGSALGFDAINPGLVSGTLPATTVTDDRGTLAGAWTVSTVATGNWLNTDDNSIAIPASSGRAYLDVADLGSLTTALTGTTDGMLLTGAELNGDSSNLGTSYTLLSGTTTLGTGSITFTPAIEVDVPAATPAGTYSAVVSQTVS